MAKFEFTAKEIEVLQKAAAEAQKAGAEKAKTIIQESGITFDIPADSKVFAPTANIVGDNNCYACFACLIFAATTFALAWTSN